MKYLIERTFRLQQLIDSSTPEEAVREARATADMGLHERGYVETGLRVSTGAYVPRDGATWRDQDADANNARPS